jgi:2'-5' RNA ligase
MPFAVEMFLDPTSAATVRQVWRKLAAAGVSAAMREGGGRPHVTLAVCERLDRVGFAPVLARFAATTVAPRLSFASFGVFPTEPAVVFMAPVVTTDLLSLHARLHRRFAEFASEQWTYYLPGQWVPHCTLAEQLPGAAVPRALDLFRQVRLPLACRLEEIGIVEFRPIEHRETFAFGGS